jgi:hypothetical protein
MKKNKMIKAEKHKHQAPYDLRLVTSDDANARGSLASKEKKKGQCEGEVTNWIVDRQGTINQAERFCTMRFFPGTCEGEFHRREVCRRC